MGFGSSGDETTLPFEGDMPEVLGEDSTYDQPEAGDQTTEGPTKAQQQTAKATENTRKQDKVEKNEGGSKRNDDGGERRNIGRGNVGGRD